MMRQPSLLNGLVRRGAIALLGLGSFLAILGARLYLRREYAPSALRAAPVSEEGREPSWWEIQPDTADILSASTVGALAAFLLFLFLRSNSAKGGLVMATTAITGLAGPFVWTDLLGSVALRDDLVLLTGCAGLAGIFLSSGMGRLWWLALLLTILPAFLHPTGWIAPSLGGLLAGLQGWNDSAWNRSKIILMVAGVIGIGLGVLSAEPARWVIPTALMRSGPIDGPWCDLWVTATLQSPLLVWLCFVLLRSTRPNAFSVAYGAIAAWVTVHVMGATGAEGLKDQGAWITVGWLANLGLILSWGEPLEPRSKRRWRMAAVAIWFSLFSYAIIRKAEALLPFPAAEHAVGAQSSSIAPLESPINAVLAKTTPSLEDFLPRLTAQLMEGGLQILWIGAGLAFSSSLVLLVLPAPRSEPPSTRP